VTQKHGTGKAVLLRATQALREGTVTNLHIPKPGFSTPGKETQHPLYRRLGWHQGQSGWVRQVSTPPGSDPRTVQLVARRYAGCAIQNHDTKQYKMNN
jgi:hypothetical protein